LGWKLRKQEAGIEVRFNYPVPVAWSLIEDALPTITMELQLIGQVGA
jgi:hypothetical protein